MGYKGRMTGGHGFREIASTILHEQGFDHAHIELQLAHQERNAVGAAYNHALYLKQRARDDAGVGRLSKGLKSENVVPLRRRAGRAKDVNTRASAARSGLDYPSWEVQSQAAHLAQWGAKMKKAVARLLSGVLVFTLGIATGLTAQTLSDSPQRKEQKRTDLTGAPNMEVIASIFEVKPGESSMLHAHHGVEVIYVLQGASIQPPGQEPRMLPSGLTLLNLRDVKHGAFKVVGDAPLKLFTVHIVDKDKPLYD